VSAAAGGLTGQGRRGWWPGPVDWWPGPVDWWPGPVDWWPGPADWWPGPVDWWPAGVNGLRRVDQLTTDGPGSERGRSGLRAPPAVTRMSAGFLIEPVLRGSLSS